MRNLAEKDDHIIYLSFSRNFGKEAAMYAGFCNAKGDYVAVMDADMQDPPDLLPQMLEILGDEGENYDSVATRRVDRVGEPPIRSWFARKFYQIINRISEADIVDEQPWGYIDPEEIAALIEFLLSDKSKKITGANIPISAGILGEKQPTMSNIFIKSWRGVAAS